MASLSLNKVFLAGNLTRDPEVRYLPSGMAVAEFGMAVNERYKDSASNEWKEKPVFVELVVWDRQAQTCGEYLKKGSPVLIEGRLQFDQWENAQGEKRSKLRVNASRVHFLGSPSDRERRQDDSPDGTGENPSPQSDKPDSDFRVPPAETDSEDLPF